MLAQHLAVGVAGFDQRVGVAEHAVAGFQFDIELLVLGNLQQPQRNVAGRGAGLAFVTQEIPLPLRARGTAGAADDPRYRSSGGRLGSKNVVTIAVAKVPAFDSTANC